MKRKEIMISVCVLGIMLIVFSGLLVISDDTIASIKTQLRKDNVQIQKYKRDLTDMKKNQQELNNKIEELNKDNEKLKKQLSINPPPTSTPSRGGSFLSMEYLGHFKVTAYSLAYRECGKHPWDNGYGITANGTYVTAWHTIAMDESIPMGTKVFIPYFQDYPNHGIFIKEDHGGAIKGNIIDVYMQSVNDCNNFGVHYLDVYEVR